MEILKEEYTRIDNKLGNIIRNLPEAITSLGRFLILIVLFIMIEILHAWI